MEDYIVLADIPTIQLESEEESPGNRRRNQSPSPCRGNRLRADRLVVSYGAVCHHCIDIVKPIWKNTFVASRKRTVKTSFDLAISYFLRCGQRGGL